MSEAKHLTELDNKTSVAINAAAVTALKGTTSEIEAAYTANSAGTISGLGDENIFISNIGTIASSQITSLDAATTGTVTLSGAGSLTLTTIAGETLDLSGVTNSLSGTLTINDSTGDNNIVGNICKRYTNSFIRKWYN